MRTLIVMQYIGGNNLVTIPRALVRELGLLRGTYVSVRRGDGRSIIVEPLQEDPNAPGTYAVTPTQRDTRTSSPTAREHRRAAARRARG